MKFDFFPLPSTKYTVVYCYPKDDTPGCTLEAQEFTALIAEFQKNNTSIIGVSPQSDECHAKFIEKYTLKIQLIADEEKTILTFLGAWGEKKNYGKTYEGVIRSTFLVENATKEIIKEWKNVKAAGHAQKVLDFITTL